MNFPASTCDNNVLQIKLAVGGFFDCQPFLLIEGCVAVKKNVIIAAALLISASMAWAYSQSNRYPLVPTGENVKIPADAFYYNGHHYYVFNNVADTWEDAQRYCKNRGGYLAIISDAAENRNVYDMMLAYGYRNAYFGLTDLYEKNIWCTADGERATYTNWSAGEPNNCNGNEHYGMFYHGSQPYQWNDGNFSDVEGNGGRAFICEWDK